MTPFKVTFRFASPVVTDSEYPIHLDGLLAWCAMDEAEKNGSEVPWDDAEDLSMVLEREDAQQSEQWCWRASRLIFTPSSGQHFINMIRKTDPVAYLNAYDAGKFTKRVLTRIDSISGQTRAYQLLTTYQWMDKAEAWGVGDIDVVRELLQRLPGIGKQTRNGFGTIREVTVEISDEALEYWRKRTLPMGVDGTAGVSYATVNSTLRPPYWRKTERDFAQEPII